MINICLVYLKTVRSEKADFAALVPLRMAKILGDAVQLHVVYMGSINEKKLRQNGIQVHCYGGSLSRVRWVQYLGLIRHLVKVAREKHIDIFQNIWFHYGIFPIKAGSLVADVSVVARIAGEPISVAQTSNPIRWMRNRLGLMIERVSLATADHIQVLSHSLYDTFRCRGIDPDRMSILSQGCDTEAFSPVRENHSCASGDDTSDMGEKKPRLLYVGRLAPEKGLEDLLEAFDAIAKEFDDVQLDLVGEGPPRLNAKYRKWVEEKNLDDRVHFRGYTDHESLKDLYRSAAVFILPSYREGLPNALMEAMASSTPCVGTNVGAIPQLLENDRGKVVPPNNPECLAAAIRFLLQNPHYAAGAGKRARGYIVRNHSFGSLKQR